MILICHLGCVPLIWSGSGSVIRDHLDHGRQHELMNPCPEWIHQFIWSTMIQVISHHWSWSGPSQRNAPLVLCHLRQNILLRSKQVPGTIAAAFSTDAVLIISPSILTSKAVVNMLDCLQSAFSLKIRLTVLISASAIANHDIMLQ